MDFLIKKLVGHSGCELELLETDNNFLVRKISYSGSYNKRLENQFAKQKAFRSDTIFAPEVFSAGLKDNLFYFDMQFINSKTLAEYLSTTLTTEISGIIKFLFKNIYKKNSNSNSESNLIFKNKIKELENHIKENESTKKAFFLLNNYNWGNVYESPCHGDLTLENILITPDKKIYLIDFLDSFYNSWMIDVAKLMQDLELGWSFRKEENNTNLNLRLLIAKEALLEEIGSLDNPEIVLNSIYHLLLLNTLRIYPYTKDDETFDLLNKSLDKISTIIENRPIGVFR